MKSIINLGIWNNKKYHFDWENKILMEEISTPSNWYYIWVPITLFLIDKISALITQIGLLENMWTRVFLVVFLSLPAYFSAKLIIRYYHSSLKLKRSELEGAQKEAFIKGLKRRKVFFATYAILFHHYNSIFGSFIYYRERSQGSDLLLPLSISNLHVQI